MSLLTEGGKPRALMDGERQQPAFVEGRHLCCVSGGIEGGKATLLDQPEVQLVGSCLVFTEALNSFMILLLLHISMPWSTV